MSKEIKQCDTNCIVHKLITHNTCVACECFKTSPYFKDDIKGMPDKEIERLKAEALEEM